MAFNFTIMDIAQDTIITFPGFKLKEPNARVLYAQPNDERTDHSTLLVVTDTTPFHPVDNVWPDQPSDVGALELNGTAYEIIGSYTGAMKDGKPPLLVDKAIPVKRSEPGWFFVVVHEVLSHGITADDLTGKQVGLAVEPERRKQLSRVHTAAHLMSLSLNGASKNFWSKPVPTDCFGNPNLDQAAIQQSAISTSESIDTYRLGKSLRKSGFDTSAFLSSIGETIAVMEREVNGWIRDSSEAKAWITPLPANLRTRRQWQLQLSPGLANIPCGGTHLEDLKELGTVTISFDLSPDGTQLTIHTRPAIT